MIDRTIQTPDGRSLRVQEAGDPGGVPILYHAGTPNSRIIFRKEAEIAERMGVRMLCYDRPGYGGSTRQEGRTIGSCAADVRTIAEVLGIRRLGVYGASGGGPHALGCAALLDDLVPAVGVLASLAPWGSEGLDYFDGMGELNVEDIRLYFSDPAAARAQCESERLEFIAASADELFEAMKSLLSPVDAAVLTGELAEFFVVTTRDGLAPGADGWWDDGVATFAPWGFDLAAITTPVLLLQGRQDRFVPFVHGEWLSHHIPGVEARLLDHDGHLTLYENHLEGVFSWLLERL